MHQTRICNNRKDHLFHKKKHLNKNIFTQIRLIIKHLAKLYIPHSFFTNLFFTLQNIEIKFINNGYDFVSLV